MLAALLLVAVADATSAHGAAADNTVEGDTTAWNGLARFYAIARGLGWRVETPAALDLTDLGLGDILVVVAPSPALKADDMLAFVEAGGSLLLADEAADGELWQRLGLTVMGEHAIQAPTYWQNLAWAPIAHPLTESPLTEGVEQIVANHPLALANDPRNVIGFDADHGLVAVGVRGQGTYVAFADASLVINRMMEFSGNARLAANVLRYLALPQTSRVIVVMRDFEVTGALAREGDERGGYERSLADLNHWLGDLRDWMLTPSAFSIAVAAGFALLALLALATMWRRERTAHAQLAALLAHGTRPALVAGNGPRTQTDMVAIAIWIRDDLEETIARHTGVAFSLTIEQRTAGVALGTRHPAAGSLLRRAAALTRHLPQRYGSASSTDRVTFSPRALRRLMAVRSELLTILGESPLP